MDFKDQIKQQANRVDKLKDQIHTEEATKNAFIMPFIQLLGYDVFDPIEVIPEMVCDIGAKKGEKIDYCIMQNGKPIILIECKHWGQDLNLHDNQLLRYFGVSKAKFGILTNGIIFRFYTDLEASNIMDSAPFLEVDMLNIKDNQIEELKKFHKSYFDVDSICSTAADLKYTNEFKNLIINEMNSPSDALTRMLSKQIYKGLITPKYVEYFGTIIKKSFHALISDTINDRLKSALKAEVEKSEEVNSKEIKPITSPQAEIVTTEEELQGYYIVKSILYGKISDINRITYRDTLSYFGILLDDNNRKPICRLYLNGGKKYLETFGENKVATKHSIETIEDIYSHSESIVECVAKYE